MQTSAEHMSHNAVLFHTWFSWLICYNVKVSTKL